jgi:hypothetical protein
VRTFLFVLIAACAGPATSSAQCSPGRTPPARPRAVSIGSAADDSARLGALLGACWGNGTLLRSAPALSSIADSIGFHAAVVDLQLETIWNSEIPLSLNDGSLWAGRGMNATLSGGVVGSYGRLRFMLAPRLNVSQNKPFGILPSGRVDRSAFASPWRSGTRSADLPLRFGSERYATVDPGETFLESSVGPMAFGATSAAAWWGSGTRNALLMSNNAGGIPQVYLRTARPLSTRLGEVEGVWLLGQLTESPFFDREAGNDSRSLSAAAITLRVAADTGLRIGIGRSVYAVSRLGRLPAHAADVFLRWLQPSPLDSTTGTADQITTLFAKWTIPDAGLAAHFEWARMTIPRSLRDLMVNPQDGQGYTVGLEWAKPLSTITTVRIQSEFTFLDQTPLQTGGEAKTFYTSELVPQGYTLRGQSIGASIGPGGSSQYLGATLFRGRFAFGASLGRIRWEEDSYYRPPSIGRIGYHSHDVSLFASLSAAADWRWGQVELIGTRTHRMNYLFQTSNPFFFDGDFDVRNNSLSVRATPHLFR